MMFQLMNQMRIMNNKMNDMQTLNNKIDDLRDLRTDMKTLKNQLDYMINDYNRQNEAMISRIDRTFDGLSGGSFDKFKIVDLRYFHPNCSSSYDSELVIVANRETIYRDVFAFTDRALDSVLTIENDEICRNLPTCFRGEARS